jgi:hypothetical protein
VPGPPITNDDDDKMAELGFGNDVIEAKINQATAVDCKLEAEDRLKSGDPPDVGFSY